MRVFANLFLILFLADGGISILDELLSLLSPGMGLPGLRYLVAGVVIVMSVAIYLCLGIDKRLPKRVFLPQILYLFWCSLATWFFPSLSGNSVYGLLASFGQVFLGVLPIFLFRKMGGHNLLMTKAMFKSPFFNIRNTLLFGAANLFIIPIALLLLGLSSANSYLDKQTCGFMRLAPDGLYMTERVYRLNNKTIRLVSMIHVGEKAYYDDLVRSFHSGRTIVLAEGVTDEKNLLRNKFGYGKMAGFLGLTSQEKMQIDGRLIKPGEIDDPRFERSEAGKADILRADVDIRSFHPITISFLNTFGKYLMNSSSIAEALLSFNKWANKNVTPEVNKTIMDDVLYQRNKEVIRHLGKAVARYDTIVIPWGALHMPEIEKSVLARGFLLKEEKKRISIDFRKLVLGKCSGTSIKVAEPPEKML